jgi:tRNA G46 methylase TrmB
MRVFKAHLVPTPSLPATLAEDLTRSHRFIDLEIGAGQGLHAIRYCQAHPDRRLIAVERTITKYNQFTSRYLAHARPENLIPLHADAVPVVTHLIGPASLDRVFLLYPNPYPKAKQANRRWHNSPFIEELKRKMKPGAQLCLATNLEWYAEEARAGFTATWGFQLSSDVKLEAGAPARTHFEKKYLERGQTCFDLVFTLPGNAPGQ